MRRVQIRIPAIDVGFRGPGHYRGVPLGRRGCDEFGNPARSFGARAIGGVDVWVGGRTSWSFFQHMAGPADRDLRPEVHVAGEIFTAAHGSRFAEALDRLVEANERGELTEQQYDDQFDAIHSAEEAAFARCLEFAHATSNDLEFQP